MTFPLVAFNESTRDDSSAKNTKLHPPNTMKMQDYAVTFLFLWSIVPFVLSYLHHVTKEKVPLFTEECPRQHHQAWLRSSCP